MKAFAKRKALRQPLQALGCMMAIVVPFSGALAADSDVIGRIGNMEVNAGQVRALIQSLDARQQAAINGNPVMLGQVVRQMLAQRALVQEALSKKWDQKPDVAAQLQRVREGTIADTYLVSQTTPPDNYPSDEELKVYYEANQAAFVAPRQFELAQIFIALARDADKATETAARANLDKVQKRLRQRNADFAAIAKETTEDKTAAEQGGKMPWLFENQITPEIRSVVAGMTKGAVADPIRLDDGWHIIKLLDTKPAATRPLAEMREQLVRQLRTEWTTEMRRTYLAKLLEKNPVALNELALQKLATPGQ